MCSIGSECITAVCSEFIAVSASQDAIYTRLDTMHDYLTSRSVHKESDSDFSDDSDGDREFSLNTFCLSANENSFLQERK